MKALLARLTSMVTESLEVPAEPEALMHAFCEAMSDACGRPVQLVFEAFPAEVPVSGLRLELEDERDVIVIERRAVPEAQLVILGHELLHVWRRDGHCGHSLSAAARGLGGEESPDVMQRAVEHVLASVDLPRSSVRAMAARSASAAASERDAESFGLHFAREARRRMIGRYAQGAASATTRAGRIQRSLLGGLSEDLL
ncbi:toxin [Streptomyces sp. NPDC002553]|uniref:toxin n=1 Tax=Streptomyces sp. NPDC002553 TaxID=3154417 RepID=UPI00331B7899